jgi:hypothetical protein
VSFNLKIKDDVFVIGSLGDAGSAIFNGKLDANHFKDKFQNISSKIKQYG